MKVSGEAEPGEEHQVPPDGSVHLGPDEYLHCICCPDNTGNYNIA